MSSIYSPGQIVGGRYRIVSALSQGGMGAVYLAQQISLGREVALKVILEQNQDPELIKRFDVEARQVCLLKHPNIITYHDYGRDEDGRPFLVMEFLAGYPGTKLVYGERRTGVKDLLHVVAQMCSALHEAHQKGIVHRDLKWSNVMVCPQSHDPFFAKLIDFGIMKMATDGSSGDQRQLTVTGMLLGTPEYMSPEAICGMPIDGRADQYSLAVMLWEALEGRRPFTGATQFELLRQQVQEMPPAFENARPLVEAYPTLEEIILRAMEKHPDDRFQNILELRDALMGAIGAGPARALPSTANRRATGEIRPHTAQPIPKSQRLAATAPAPMDTSHKTSRERPEAAPRGPSRWLLFLVAALVLIGAGAAVAVLLTSGRDAIPVAPGPDVVQPSTQETQVGMNTPDASAPSPADVNEAETALGGPAPATTKPPVATVAQVEDVVASPPDTVVAPDVAAVEDATAVANNTPPEAADASAAPPQPDAASTAERPATKPPPTKPPPASAQGTLIVQALPTASVWINGTSYGRTPVEVKLKAGTANIVLEYAYGDAGKNRKTRTVKIKPDDTTRVIVDMRAE